MSRKEKKNNAFLLILLPQKKKNLILQVTRSRPLLAARVLFRALMKQSDVNLRVEVNFLRGTTEDKHAVDVCRTSVWGG